MPLPAPMLARSGRLPTDSGYAFELKWDGFRALVRTGDDFRVRSRGGWNMTELLPELRELPVDAVLDGELVALGDDEWPDFPLRLRAASQRQPRHPAHLHRLRRPRMRRPVDDAPAVPGAPLAADW